MIFVCKVYYYVLALCFRVKVTVPGGIISPSSSNVYERSIIVMLPSFLATRRCCWKMISSGELKIIQVDILTAKIKMKSQKAYAAPSPNDAMVLENQRPKRPGPILTNPP